MIIYHGSKDIIKNPMYGFGKTTNDYGRGFYCTRFKELAKEWAVGSNNDGYVNSYEINDSNLKTLNLFSKEYNILNWLALLVNNRKFEIMNDNGFYNKEYLLSHFLIDTKPYDLIRGYRADDSYFVFAKAFLNNGITLKKLKRVMYLGELGEQVVLVSKKAFKEIKYLDNETVKADEYFPLRFKRDYRAREEYIKTYNDELSINDVLFNDIIKEKWSNNDERLY